MKLLVKRTYKDQTWTEVEEIDGYPKVELDHRRKDRSLSTAREVSEGSSKTLQGESIFRSQDKS